MKRRTLSVEGRGGMLTLQWVLSVWRAAAASLVVQGTSQQHLPTPQQQGEQCCTQELEGHLQVHPKIQERNRRINSAFSFRERPSLPPWVCTLLSHTQIILCASRCLPNFISIKHCTCNSSLKWMYLFFIPNMCMCIRTRFPWNRENSCCGHPISQMFSPLFP